MGKKVSSAYETKLWLEGHEEEKRFLRWVDSIDSDDADYLDDWFNLAEQEDFDNRLTGVPYFVDVPTFENNSISRKDYNKLK